MQCSRVTDYGLGDPGLIYENGRGFFFRPLRSVRLRDPLNLIGYLGGGGGVKARPGRDAGALPPSGAEDKNE
jgi:hypothetical protein